MVLLHSQVLNVSLSIRCAYEQESCSPECLKMLEKGHVPVGFAIQQLLWSWRIIIIIFLTLCIIPVIASVNCFAFKPFLKPHEAALF